MHQVINCIFALGLLSLLTMCSSKARPSEGDLVEFDIHALQLMPIEEFDFDSNSSIVNIEYFQPNDSIIFPFGLPIVGDTWVSMNNSGVIIIDKLSGEVVASFDRTGGGPEEYVNILGLGVDYSNKTCHVLTSDSPSKIKTYSFDGVFLNEVQLKGKISPESRTFGIYNNSYYFVAQNSIRRILTDQDDPLDSRPYLLIDRKSGEIKALPIDRLDYKICNRYVPKRPDVLAPNWAIDIKDFHGGENKLIISEFSNDTIFAVLDGQVNPIAVKRNWDKDYDSTDLVSVLYAGSRYMIFEIIRKTTDHSSETISYDKSKSGTYIFDLKNREFHRYSDTGLFWESNGHLFMLQAVDNLMDAADNGEIYDPKLLEIIEKSDDESNFVWITYCIAE